MAACFDPFLDHTWPTFIYKNVPSVRTIHRGIPYHLQDVRNNNFKSS